MHVDACGRVGGLDTEGGDWVRTGAETHSWDHGGIHLRLWVVHGKVRDFALEQRADDRLRASGIVGALVAPRSVNARVLRTPRSDDGEVIVERLVLLSARVKLEQRHPRDDEEDARSDLVVCQFRDSLLTVREILLRLHEHAAACEVGGLAHVQGRDRGLQAQVDEVGLVHVQVREHAQRRCDERLLSHDARADALEAAGPGVARLPL
eukprot:scaffold140556_cov181-Phaeocystis_antarctica.AAC.1